MIALAVFTDGRDDLLARTLESAEENLRGPITRRVIFDDTGDLPHGEALTARFPTFDVVHHTRRLGFGGTIRAAWAHLATFPVDYVFHLEDDFTFNHPVNLADPVGVLDARPYLAQLALRRQPWNHDERTAGGVVEQHPDDYTEVRDGGHAWLEHRRHFTTNPCLYRRSLCERGWPQVEFSEGRFSIDLFTDPGVRCGFWGARDSGEAVTHIGRERVGSGY